MATSWVGGKDIGALGPIVLKWDTASGGADLDLGDYEFIEWAIETTYAEIKGARYGTAAKDHRVSGQRCTVKINAAETNLEFMEAVFPGFHVNRTTGNSIVGYSYGRVTGRRQRANAKQLDAVTLIDDSESTDTNEAMSFWLASPMGNQTQRFDAESQRFVEAAFEIYADPNRQNSPGHDMFFGSGFTGET